VREIKGSVSHIAQAIEEDLKLRNTGLQKPHIPALADLTATVLMCRSVNTSEWRSILPRTDCSEKAKENYISRFLANPLILPIRIMGGFVPEVLQKLSANQEIMVLMLDQSKICDGFECLMVSVRFGNRAIPIAWHVKETEGAIGFAEQKVLLDSVATMIPVGIEIMLSADRFYGTANLIEWCQKHGWHYRIRLKSNLILIYQGEATTTGALASAGKTSLCDAKLGKVITHIGIIHEKGHPEPWIIAMDAKPTQARTLDYGMRWGIEALFSDFKSKGFGITQTHLKHPSRIERLILILTIAIYWAVSTGMKPQSTSSRVTPKKKKAILCIFL
jgi:Transposase DDE domain